MTVGIQPAAVPMNVEPAPAAGHSGRLALIILSAIVLLFAGTYAFAWSQANALSSRYLLDADQSYQRGDYLKALVGYQDFNPASNTYVTHGGYLQVERIWNGRYAWPVPAGVQRAPERANEIINQKLTIDQAVQFVQENTGKPNPYFGVIYLRLGELYQLKGDNADAHDVYQTVIQSFKDQPDLIKQAQDRLAQLPSK
jgi:tetratricopeptide (TPR) repeat protein